MVRTLLIVVLVVAACGTPNNHQKAIGDGCDSDGQCASNHCAQSYCSECAANSDCADGQLCGKTPRYLGAAGGPFCVSADAGCATTASQCPTGFSCTGCDAGYACNDTTGNCYSVMVPPPPVCGASDLSHGYDAGNGPPPDLAGTTCYSCIGCPLGSECLCGATGLGAGLRCDNGPAALACFVTGGVGECKIFAGDCASNAQCSNTPLLPLCNAKGRCVGCLRDADCGQTGSAHGCIDGTCYPCCTSNAQCPNAGECITGFCYACTRDGGCAVDAGTDGGSDGGSGDGGTPDGGSDAGLSDGGDGG